MSWKDLTNRAMDWVKEKGAEIFSPKDKPIPTWATAVPADITPGLPRGRSAPRKWRP